MDKVLDTLNKKVFAANKHNDVIKQYKVLRTDEERIIFTLNIMLEYDVVPQVCGDTKNAEESEKLRREGNKVFVSTPLTNVLCVKALKLYTKSIAYAPSTSEQLALAYANRSAVLIKLHKYEECIQDLNRALALSYPDNLKAKLYVRKLECLQALKRSNIENDIKETQEWLDKMSLNDTNYKKLNEKIVSVRKTSRLYKSKAQNITKSKKEFPLLTVKTPNTEVPCASDAVVVKYNEKYGRHIVAARKINPGEVIAVEKAYSLILNPDNVHTHCSHCLEVSWVNIPCDYCTYAMYCSEECRDASWKQFHHIECSIIPTMLKMEFLKLDLFSLRLAVQAVRESSSIQELREELEVVDTCDDPRTKGFSKNGVFESNKYRSLLGLVTNTEKRSVQDLFGRSLDASFILYFLATCTNIFGKPLNDLSGLLKNTDVTFVGGLILRHKQIIPCNIHSFSEECGLDAVERGIAALPFLSLINHSCQSNITRHSRPQHIIIYAILPIQEGEQELLRRKEDERKINHVLRKFSTYVDIATQGNVLDKPYIVDDLTKMIQVLYELVQMPCLETNNVVETLKRVYDISGNKFEIPEL